MEPFIGAKHDLISNAQVRYTGTLLSINEEEQTCASRVMRSIHKCSHLSPCFCALSDTHWRYAGLSLLELDEDCNPLFPAHSGCVVRSSGTEHRSRSDGLRIPPRPEVFKMVVFRAMDIQDLNVVSPADVRRGLE